MGSTYYLLAFDSTHAAMSAERSLLPLLPLRMMPTLRQITASCGISIRVEEKDFPALQQALRDGVVSRDDSRLYAVEVGQAHELT